MGVEWQSGVRNWAAQMFGSAMNYRSDHNSQESNVRRDAFPWHRDGESESSKSELDETAPSGPARPTMRTPATLAAELNKLKDSGVPLSSMKLVPNSDIEALQGDASRVLGLNERLARYVTYVAQLEKTNKELGERNEVLSFALDAERAEHTATEQKFFAEKSDLVSRITAAERLHEVVTAKLDDVKRELAEAAQVKAQDKARVDAWKKKAQSAEDVSQKLRDVMRDQGVPVPNELNPSAIAAAQRKESFAANMKEAIGAVGGGGGGGGGGGARESGVGSAAGCDGVGRWSGGGSSQDVRKLQAEAKAKANEAEAKAMEAKEVRVRVGELQAQLTNGTITPEGRKELERQEVQLKQLNEAADEAVVAAQMAAQAVGSAAGRQSGGGSSQDVRKLQAEAKAKANEAEAKAMEAKAVHARVGELQAQLTNGTITPEGRKELELQEVQLKQLNEAADEAVVAAQMAAQAVLSAISGAGGAGGAGSMGSGAERLTDWFNSPSYSSDCERMFDAAMAAAERARLDTRIRTLQKRDLHIPVDEPAMEEQLRSRFSPEQIASLLADDIDKAIKMLGGEAIDIPYDDVAIETQLRKLLPPAEFEALRSNEVAAEMRALAKRFIPLPINALDGKLEEVIKRSLSIPELQLLDRIELGMRVVKLREHANKGGLPSDMQEAQLAHLEKDMATYGDEIMRLCEVHLDAEERLQLTGELIAGRVSALSDHGILAPSVDHVQLAVTVASDLPSSTRGALMKAKRRARASLFETKTGQQPPVDMGALDLYMQEMLVNEEYEELLAERRARRVAMHAARGMLVPVDEERVTELLGEQINLAELKELKPEENDLMKRAAKTALRLEVLLQKEVPVSDDLLLACQRGEVWALFDLDQLCSSHLQDEEVEALRMMQDAAMVMIEDMQSDDRLYQSQREGMYAAGGGGGGGARGGGVGSAAGGKKHSYLDNLAVLERKRKSGEPLSKVELVELDKLKQRADINRLSELKKRMESGAELTDDEKSDLTVLQRLADLRKKKTTEGLMPDSGIRGGEQAEMAQLQRIADLQRKKRVAGGISVDEQAELERLAKIVALESKKEGSSATPEELEQLVQLHTQQAEAEAQQAAREAALASVIGGPGGTRGERLLGSSALEARGLALGVHPARYALEQEAILNVQRQELEQEYLRRLREAIEELRRQLNRDLEVEQLARREAQARNLALLDAIESQRARNAELQAKLAEHEARELDRLRELESLARSRELEISAFRLQAERSIEDAAEARSKREQLERAIKQYETILNAMGLGAASLDDDIQKHKSRLVDLQRKMASVGLTPEEEEERTRARERLSELEAERGGNQAIRQSGNQAERLSELEAIRRNQTQSDAIRMSELEAERDKAQAVTTVAHADRAAYLEAKAAGRGLTLAEQEEFDTCCSARKGARYGAGSSGFFADAYGGGGGGGGGGGDGRDSGVGADYGYGAGSGFGASTGGYSPELSVVSALPPSLLQLEQFVMLTDEGHVAVRARMNGTIAYLKRQVATQLHISPRLTLSMSTSSSKMPLHDDTMIAQYAEGRSNERLLLSAAPRPLSDFFPGAATLPPLRQVRVRPCVRDAPENASVIIRGVCETTTVRELQEILVSVPGLLPQVAGLKSSEINLYFSPVFITPDVLLGRAERQNLSPTKTLLQAQVIDDDILYLAIG